MKKNKLVTAGLCLAAAVAMMTACNNGNKGNAGMETTQSQEQTTEANVDLDQLLVDIKEAYGEDYLPSMDLDAESLENGFGIAPDLYAEMAGQGTLVTMHIDTILGIKANEGKGAEVEKILNDYRQDQIDNSFQYPMNMPKLYASEVVRHGDYVFFVMLGTPTMDALDEGEDAALESAKEKNQIAIDIIDEAFGA